MVIFTGTLYRGVTQHGGDYAKVSNMKVGDTISFNSLTSWAVDRNTAHQFSEPYDKSGNSAPYTVFVTRGSTKGNAFIGRYSANLENEVAVSGRNSFTLRRVVTRENQRFGKPTTYYYFD